MSALTNLLIKQVTKSPGGKTITDPFQKLRKLPKYLPNEHTFTELDLPNFKLQNNVFADSLKAPGRKDRITRQKTPKSYLIQLKTQKTSGHMALAPQWPQSSLMQSSYISNSRKVCENLTQSQIKQSLPQNMLLSPTFSVSTNFLQDSLNEIKDYEKVLRNYIFKELLTKRDTDNSSIDDNNGVEIIYDSTRSKVEIFKTTLIAFNFHHVPLISEAELKVFPAKLDFSKDKDLIAAIRALLDYQHDI